MQSYTTHSHCIASEIVESLAISTKMEKSTFCCICFRVIVKDCSRNCTGVHIIKVIICISELKIEITVAAVSSGEKQSEASVIDFTCPTIISTSVQGL